MERRRPLAALLVAGLIPLIAIAALLIIRSGTVDAALPDLVNQPPGAPAPAIVEWPQDSGEMRFVVRFDGVVSNIGEGPLHVDGDPRGSALVGNAIAQVLFNSAGDVVERLPFRVNEEGAAIQFENSDGHNHWHLMRVSEYALFDAAGENLVFVGDKIGFCLADVEPLPGVDGPEPPGVYPASNQCEPDAPGVTELAMGISPGWSDVYSFSLPLQWIDVTDQVPGAYRLAGRADPDDLLVESDEVNPWVLRDQPITIPGVVADSFTVDATGATQITLAFTSYPGFVDLTPFNDGDTDADVQLPTPDVRFRIVDGPTSGSLDVAVGEDLFSPQVTYTPSDEFIGEDGFSFVVVDAGYPDPRSPLSGRVTITVGG